MDMNKNLAGGSPSDKKSSTNEELPEGFVEVMKENKKFLEELAREELLEGRDTISSERNKIFLERSQTEIQKERFINEIKNGLGEKVKERPNEIIIIKKPWYHKLITGIKKLFSVI